MSEVIHVLVSIVFWFLNWGAAVGFILGAIWLLRPVTGRLLTPRQRFFVWALGWGGTYLTSWYQIFSWIQVFPVTLRDIISPRTNHQGMPSYLPERYEGEGPYNLAVPGGGSVQVELSDSIGLIIVLVWLAGAVYVGYRLSLGSRRLFEQGALGERLGPDHPICEYVNRTADHAKFSYVDVYLCDDIPTSFVHQRFWSGELTVFLQKNLPEHRRDLVVKHEANHIALHHCRLKGVITFALVVHWWNPLIWMAYFATCRDLELDCDERTMKGLSPQERREYAHTLLELGTGRQLWDAPLSFGECDAAMRVKAVAKWKPAGRWKEMGTWLLTILVLLCFTGGPAYEAIELPADQLLEQQQQELMWQHLVQEEPETLAVEAEAYLKESRLQDNAIAEVWVPEDGSAGMLCRISTGTWREMWVWLDVKRGEVFFNAASALELDLTGYKRIY